MARGSADSLAISALLEKKLPCLFSDTDPSKVINISKFGHLNRRLMN